MGLSSAEHPLLARYAEVRSEVSAQYGPDSQAVVFILYEELLSLRTVLAQDRSNRHIAERVRDVSVEIQRRYDIGGMVDKGRHHRLISDRPVLIEYDRAVFDRMYGNLRRACAVRPVHVTGAAVAFEALQAGPTHIYVVDDSYRLLVWPEPFTLAEMVFGRTPDRRVDGTRVVHPMLVPERLRVRAAGELSIVGGPDDCMVIANMKSGHFRPPPSCADVLRDVLRGVFPLTDEDIDVFTVPQPRA
ncbi:hypothetical protein [Streptomyces sp. NPDC049949]|uniref:hypothetical protein n=1 Tax=Streptomyces sp. NPDC049949 TaxID=3154627 RepID=UPI0034489139